MNGDLVSAEVVSRAEEILGHTFADKNLLRTALTHPSAVQEGNSVADSYERMEFLGDSVLGLVIARELYDRFPGLSEGGLTRIKVTLVSGTTLSEVALELGLTEVIIFGASETGTQGRGLVSALENVFEALVAALLLDGGYHVARTWILDTLSSRISLDLAEKLENPKSILQEYLQANGALPVYRIISEEGPPHDRVFTAVVELNGETIGEGSGSTKKEAESTAARLAIEHLQGQA